MAKASQTKTEKQNLIQVLKGDLAKLRKPGAVKKDRAGLWGKIGFAMGIISIGAWLAPVIGLPLMIVSLVMNILGLRAEKGRWFAVTGLTLTIFFLNLTMIYTFYGMLVSGA